MRAAKLALSLAFVAILVVSLAGAAYGSRGGDPQPTGSAMVPWAFQNQNQQNTGYSPETQISAANVGTLKEDWADPNLLQIAGTPVVSGDSIYVAGTPKIYVFNLKTGSLIWEDGPTVGLAQLEFRTAAGVTVANRSVYATTKENQLVALDARTGALKWIVPINSTITGDLYPYNGAEATPLVWDGIIVVGETSGDLGPTRGVIQGFSQTDGAHLWTFYITPPGPINSTNQAAWGNTWGTNGTSGCLCGGGAQWNVPAIDPKTGIIYFGTGNPYPTSDPFVREPKRTDTNLYSESIIALNVRTGKMVWYFQELKPEYEDWDQGMPVMLYNTTIRGVETQVVGVAGKAGIFFELNAATGALIYKLPLGIHLNDDIPPRDVNRTGFLLYPGDDGGVNTFSSFNPQSNMVYTIEFNNANWCKLVSGQILCRADTPIYPNSTLYAIDASTGKVAWSTNLVGLGGGVSTADNVVYYADGNHTFYAANALTGQVLWTYHDTTGYDVLFSWGPPSIVDGYVLWETYGAGATPGHLIAFRLGSGHSEALGSSAVASGPPSMPAAVQSAFTEMTAEAGTLGRELVGL